MNIFTLASILGIIFITLKLTGHIAWAWIWVTSPFWIAAILWVLIVALVRIYAEKKRNKFHSEINDRFNKFR